MGWTERILSRGYWEKGLFDIILALVTNFNATLTKLDADTTVTDTNYNSLYAVTSPTIGNTYGKKVKYNGALQADIVLLLKRLRNNFNSVMDKLAADGGVTGTTVFTNLKLGTTTLPIDISGAKIKQLGMDQGIVFSFLDTFLANFNSALVLLDADGIADTDYWATYHISDTVGPSSSSSSCRSSSSSSSCRSSSSCSSSSSRSSSSSCSSSCRSSSSSSCSSSCRSSSSSSSSRSLSSSSSSCRSSSSSCSSSSSQSSSSCSSSSSSSISSSSSSCRSSSSSSSSSSSQAIT